MSVIGWAFTFLISVYITIPIVLYLLSPSSSSNNDPYERKRAIVLVLGDLGRSPRMNYHALSLAKCGFRVDLCGYNESKLMEEITEQNELITIHSLPIVTNSWNLPFIIFGPIKVLWQHWLLYKLLRQLKGADYLFVQNPPSIPALGVVRFFSLFMSPRTKIIIDWHNLGYSILALKFATKDNNGENHPFVKFYRWYENWFGYRAFVHLTVTLSLADVLRNEFGMNARRILPLHDKPGSQFGVISSDVEKQEIISKHSDNIFKDFDFNKEKILVTSTSYTPDENLYTLLSALKKYSRNENLPHLRVIITGKGPMLEEMKNEISKLLPSLGNRVSIHTIWLAYEDYPKILGIADLGVSLHESSSGWDLPMKIVDMFGCGVPVVAIGFPALPELVKQDENGVIVENDIEMAQAFQKVFTDDKFFTKIKQGAVRESRLKWDTNWMLKLGPLFGIGEYRRPAPGEDDSSSGDD